ncbi:hypothetical protein Dimus_019455 [Dionaea muscipula]
MNDIEERKQRLIGEMAKGRKERRRRRENRENPRLIGEMASVSTKKSELAFTGEDDGESSGTAAAAAAAATLYIMDSSHLIGVDLNDLDEKMKLLAQSAAEDPPYPLLTCDIDLEEDGYNRKSVLMKHGSKIFLVGGLAEDDESRDVFVFDVFDAFDDKPIPSSKMNARKYHPRVVTIEGSAYVFGIEYAELCPGQSYDDRDLDTPSFEVLPRGSNCWKALPDPPFYFKCDSKIEEELDSTFVIGSRIFVRTSIYPPFDREGFHVFNVESNEWDEKEVNLSRVKESFERVGLKLPEYGRSVGGCDIGGEGNHVFLFSNYQYMEYEPCIWNFYAGIVTGTGILLWYQDITGVVLPSHTIPAGYDCHISHMQVLENLSACVTMYGWSESMDLKASVVCVSFFKFSLKQSHNQMSRTSSRTEFLSLLATKNYAFYVDRVATARSVLLSLGDMGGHSVWNKDTMAWPRDKETAFIGILYEKVKIGKLQCSTFTKDEWAKINEELIAATSWDYGIERLKEKWNRLRMAHRLFTSLIEHTGVTWDPNTNVVNAAEEVWNHFYTINKTEYKTFRKEGFRHYEVLGEIFHGTSTRGLHDA